MAVMGKERGRCGRVGLLRVKVVKTEKERPLFTGDFWEKFRLNFSKRGFDKTCVVVDGWAIVNE